MHQFPGNRDAYLTLKYGSFCFCLSYLQSLGREIYQYLISSKQSIIYNTQKEMLDPLFLACKCFAFRHWR